MRTQEKVNLREIEAAWRTRGFSFGVWTDPPGQVWENYVHDADELFMVAEGEVEIEMEGEILRPGPGDEVLIPAKTRHTVRNTGNIAAHWLYGYRR